MRQQSLGINIDQTMIIPAPIVGIDSTFLQKMTAFKQELQQQSSIKHNCFYKYSRRGGWVERRRYKAGEPG
jgi:hypothetical protein